jgi:hypothetical protein
LIDLTISLTGRLCIKTGWGIGDPDGGTAREGEAVLEVEKNGLVRILLLVGVEGAGEGALIIGTFDFGGIKSLD